MVVKGDSLEGREGREKVATKRRKRKLIIGLSTKTKVCFCTREVLENVCDLKRK